MAEHALYVRDLGRIAFPAAHELQLELVTRRHAGECPDTLLLCEHDPVITLGRATGERWMRAGLGRDESHPGIPVCRIERGGEATYHGPGQLVAYPILDLREHGRDIHRFIRSLEEVIIGVVADFDVSGERREGLTGVWVGEAKIAAIGVAIRRWISFHGVALNLDCDLSVYDRIIPCGVPEARTTSVARELGEPVGMDAAKASLIRHFAHAFGSEVTELFAVSKL